MNKTIIELVKSMRLHVGLPKQIQIRIVNTAIYLINYGQLVPLNESLLEGAWSSKEINLSHLKVFSCPSYIYIDVESKSKFDLKFVKYTFIEYNLDEFDYKFWNYQNVKFIKSRDITFNKNKMYKDINGTQHDSQITPEDSFKYVEIEDVGAQEDT